MAQTLDCISNRLKGVPDMNKISLTALAREHLEVARAASSGRSAHTVYGGHEHSLRQTLIALKAGSALDEHEAPAKRRCKSCTGGYVSPIRRRSGRGRPVTTSSSRTPGTV